MTTGGTRAKALADGRRADSARRRQRVIAAINRAATDGTEISVSAIARAAAVDRTFLYRHRDLLGQIHATQAGPPGAGAGPAVTRASLQADLLAAHQRALRLTARIQQLETACPKRSATRPGANPGSAPPPASTRSTTRSPIWTSKSSTCGSSSKNATANSLPPAPPTGNSWPGSTRQPTAKPVTTCTTPVALRHHKNKPLSWKNRKTALICPICPPENELLVWLIRTSGPTARRPSAVHHCKDATCRAAVHPFPASAIDGERSGGSERGTPDPTWRPAGQPAVQVAHARPRAACR